jgi:hypothetical protein
MVALNTPMKQRRLDGKQGYHWLIRDTRFPGDNTTGIFDWVSMFMDDTLDDFQVIKYQISSIQHRPSNRSC